MQGLEEIAIIHSIKDYQAGLFIKESLKLEGFSYFVYAYNELDDRPNELFEKSNNKFDLILYINDDSKIYQKRFEKLAYHNVAIKIEENEIWDAYHQLKDGILTDIWNVILETVEYTDDIKNTRKIMAELSKVYCKYDLFRRLLNNTEAWFTMVREKQTEEIYKKRLEEQKKGWQDARNHLYEFSEKLSNDISAKEHLDYAILYCERKLNDIYDLLGDSFPYSSWEMLKQADRMHDLYNMENYMIENLISQIAKQSYEYKSIAILSMKNCTQKCQVAACNSFHYYRMAKLYEKARKMVQAEICYEKAYELNPVNFRAAYKCGLFSFNKKKNRIAKQYFREILQLLQVKLTYSSVEKVEDSITTLPALELEYVCKCFVLLAEIERQEVNMDNKFYDYCLEKCEQIVQMIDEGKNTFIEQMYSDNKLYMMYLKHKLSIGVIKKKIQL